MEDEEEKHMTAKVSGDGEAAVERLMEVVEEIAKISDYRNAYKKQFGNLSRRVKLLAPMFEELKESREPIPDEAVRGLVQLREALDAARELLRFGSDGSKICLVIDAPSRGHILHDAFIMHAEASQTK